LICHSGENSLALDTITYNFAGGVAINSNAITGEYHMVVPNSNVAGGQTVYSRIADEHGYHVNASITDCARQLVLVACIATNDKNWKVAA